MFISKTCWKVSFVESSWGKNWVTTHGLQCCSARDVTKTGATEQTHPYPSMDSTEHYGDTVTVYSCFVWCETHWKRLPHITSMYPDRETTEVLFSPFDEIFPCFKQFLMRFATLKIFNWRIEYRWAIMWLAVYYSLLLGSTQNYTEWF